MSQQNEQPIIRIVKKGHGGGHHGGAWKVAYADFVTAMMALFIVLWILGQSEDIKRGVGGYFRDPAGKALLGAGPNESNEQLSIAQSRRADPTMVTMKDEPLRELEAEAEKLRETIEASPELEALKEQISVEVTPEGVRVEINESEREPLFESGSAQLSPKLIDALRVLATEYRKLDRPIVIEGHTDSQPYSTASAMTNWELSTLRANEARRVMGDSGLPEANIFMIRGYADRKPRFESAADPRNRRISMLLLSREGLRIAQGSSPTTTKFEPTDGPEPLIMSDKSRTLQRTHIGSTHPQEEKP
jgi:chemotaxis protein MotB